MALTVYTGKCKTNDFHVRIDWSGWSYDNQLMQMLTYHADDQSSQLGVIAGLPSLTHTHITCERRAFTIHQTTGLVKFLMGHRSLTSVNIRMQRETLKNLRGGWSDLLVELLTCYGVSVTTKKLTVSLEV